MKSINWRHVRETILASFFASRDEIPLDVYTVDLALNGHPIHPDNLEKSFERVTKVWKVLNADHAASGQWQAIYDSALTESLRGRMQQ